MSLTYSEIYSTNLRAQSNILKGENSQSKPKYVTLLKIFSKNKKSKKFKPRRIISKSVQIKNSNNSSSKPKKKNKIKTKIGKFTKSKNI